MFCFAIYFFFFNSSPAHTKQNLNDSLWERKKNNPSFPNLTRLSFFITNPQYSQTHQPTPAPLLSSCRFAFTQRTQMPVAVTGALLWQPRVRKAACGSFSASRPSALAVASRTSRLCTPRSVTTETGSSRILELSSKEYKGKEYKVSGMCRRNLKRVGEIGLLLKLYFHLISFSSFLCTACAV